MKLKRLFFIALLCIVGMSSAWAAPTDYLTGWTEVTSLPTDNNVLSKFYYVLVEGDMMIAQDHATQPENQEGELTAVYKTPADPKANKTLVWTINYNTDFLYGLRSLNKQDRYMQSRENSPWRLQCAWEANQSNWTRMDLAYSNGTWTIQNKGHRKSDTNYGSNYWGSWGEGDDRYTNGYCLAGNKSDKFIGRFKIYSIPAYIYNNNIDFNAEKPIDLTSAITNPDFNSNNANGWTVTGSGGNWNFNGAVEYWHRSNVSLSQVIYGLPAGRYEGSMQAMNGGSSQMEYYVETSRGKNTATISAGTEGNFGECRDALNTDPEKGKISATGRVTDGQLTIGFTDVSSASAWVVFDNFKLIYLGPCVEDEALTLPGGGSIVANNWYKYDISVAGDYKITTTGTVKWTQNGDLFGSEVTTTLSNEDIISLEAGTLYLSSAGNTTLSIQAFTKSYVVGSATTDKEYVQPGQTVTVSYDDAVTNDEDATFGMNGTPSITVGGQAVTITPTAKGFSFTMPNLAAGANYTIAIPANAFGYTAGSTYNAAQNLTIKTPAVYDGVYYIKDNNNKYISRGADSNTEAAIDEFGIAINVVTNASGVSTLQCVDSKDYIVENADPKIYTNGNPGNANHLKNFTLAVSNSTGVSIKTQRGNWVASADGIANSNGQAEYAWTFEPASSHAAAMTALKNAQASATATAASLSASTPAELEAAIAVAGLTESPVVASALPKNGGNYEYFQSAGTSKNTITITVPGIYKMTIKGFTRVAGYNAAYPEYTAGNENVVNYVYLGENKTQMASLFSESFDSNMNNNCAQPTGASKWYPNGITSGNTAFAGGMYENVVWAYLTPGEYEYGVAVVSNLGTKHYGTTDDYGNWVLYSPNVTLVRYSEGLNPGEDMTGKITNPGFETGNTDGWTVLESTPDKTGAKSTTDPNYEAQGSQGNYLFNIYWKGRPLTQNIGKLPAGIYQLSAMVATGDAPNNRGITFLTVNGAHSQGRISRNGNKAVMGKETMTFVSDGVTLVTIGVVGGSDEASGNVYREDGYFWYKADDFHLTYLNEYSAENLYNIFKEIYDASVPWTSGDYATTRNSYSSYNASTPTADLLAAINYMNTKFDDYAWDNASIDHPYLMSNVIKGAELNVNTDWPGSGRSMASEAGWKGQHWSGDANRDYFEHNHENQPARSQDVTMPFAGQYTLNTAVRVLQSGAFAEISIGDDKTRTKDVTGTTGGKINIDGSEGTSNMANGGNGFGWVYNKVVFPVENDNTTKKISIFLSNRDKSRAADAGGMFLYYIGDTFEYVKNKVHYYHGAWGATNAELTETVPVLDVTKATGSFNVNATNPNGLVYTNGATINGVTNNIVSNGICADLVLVDGHNFHAHKSFEATKARYTMSSIAVKPNGNKFGTLMIPFAAANKPDGCKIYNLDQDMNLAAEILATSTDVIAANKPVLVTESGEYTASNVSIAATTAGTYSNGHLTGTYTATTASEGTYVLQKHDYTDHEDNTWTIAFFLVGNNTETPTKPTVKPFHAYINKLGNNNVKAINIVFEDDVETAIESAPASQERETVIYDLSGRRVQNVQRGIYIINGKKILK